MSRSSARRGQTEPLAALAAVLVVGLALSTYADALTATAPAPGDPAVADATLQRAHDATSDGAVVVPAAVDDALATAPTGHQLNVTVAAGGRRWSAGPSPPPNADAARRRVPVERGRWTARPGWLSVEVWT